MQMDIKRGAHVHTAEGDFGKVQHVILDSETREVTDLVVNVDGDEYLVPISAVEHAAGDEVTLIGAPRDFYGRRFEQDRYHTVDHVHARNESSGEARHGGAPLLDADEDEVELAGPPSLDAATPTPTHAQGGGPASPTSYSGGAYRIEAWELYADELSATDDAETAYPSSLREGPVPDAAAPAAESPDMVPDYAPDSPVPHDMNPEDRRLWLP